MTTVLTHRASARLRRQRGVTLVELMVAMGIGLAIVAGIGYVYLQGQQGFRVQENQSRLQEDVRYVTEVVTRELQNARFLGCTTAIDSAVGSTTSGHISTIRFTGAHPWFNEPTALPPSRVWLMKDGGADVRSLRGVPNVSYALRGFDDGNGFPNTVSIAGRQVNNSDVLMFMKLGDEQRTLLEPQADMSTLQIADAIPGYKRNGRLAAIAVASCSSGVEVVKATVRNNGLRFELENTYNTSLDSEGNVVERLIKTPSPGAVIAKFEPVAYYISTAASNPTTNLPTLNRITISDMVAPTIEAIQTGVWETNGGQTIVSGVESMQLRFLVNGQYLTATEVNLLGNPNEFWPQVGAVEVTLTVISQDDKARSKSEAQTLRDGSTVTDRRLRQEVRFIVDLTANR
ncbi:MAG: PilW family protein [Casimicrobium sp.]